MKKYSLVIAGFVSLFLVNNVYSASILEIGSPDVEAYTLRWNIYQGGTYSYYTNYMRAGHLKAASNFPGKCRSFTEFDLTPWYELGISKTNITEIRYVVKASGARGAPAYNVYAMESHEDGLINPSSEEFNASLSDVIMTVNQGDSPSYVTAVLTGTALNHVTGDISDVYDTQNPNEEWQWTGFSIQLVNEENDDSIGLQRLFYAETYPDFVPVLQVYYDEPVPEPASIILLGLSIIGLVRRKMRN